MDIFRIISGILHMGNIMFSERDGESENCFIPVSDMIDGRSVGWIN